MSGYQLAQLNIGVPQGPIDSAVMADFVAQLDEINQLAERSRGFVWRLKDEANNATSFRPFDDDTLMNLSVWEDPVALRDYVYRSAHSTVMKRRREWFQHMKEANLVLWWVPSGHRPTIEEAVERLRILRSHGPCDRAFTFGKLFAPPDAAPDSSISDLSEPCPAL
jgi:hypothetical protein